MRKRISWNENWLFRKTAEVPDKLPKDWEIIQLPHTWNAKDGQDGGNDYWRGTAMYVKEFEMPWLSGGERAIVVFHGVAMRADVYVNGKHKKHHEGGYSSFCEDITEELNKGKNLLCVAVSNEENDHVYPQKADFTFYGGIYRDVEMLIVPGAHLGLTEKWMSGIKITPMTTIGENGAKASVFVETFSSGGSGIEVTIHSEEGTLMKSAPVVDGYAQVIFEMEQVHLWNGVNDPYLYQASAVLYDGKDVLDAVSARFGCRTTAFSASEGFYLNGTKYPLRGVSRHQDRLGKGNAITAEEHLEDMELIKEIGANTIRLAHYQHAQEFYDLCDQYGMVVWAEIPYITCHMPNGRKNTISQMEELISQCYNHPSVICWGLSNEITVSGGVTDDLLENNRILNQLCHEMDHTRPTTMAHAFMLEMDSKMHDISDIESYNLYYGWYLGELGDNDQFFDEFHKMHPNKVIGFSEYGADVNPDYHSSRPEKGDYSEEYGCIYHEHMLEMIGQRPYLWSAYVWNMFDFAADGRDEGGKHGVNQKGLVTMDRKLKKDTFYLYKAYWSKEPFVHICGRRYKERTEDRIELKVYSNLENVSLWVDGKMIDTLEGSRIFRFSIPLTAKHQIKAAARDKMGIEYADNIEIWKVEKENPKYHLLKREDVVNWFDKEELDESCFSLKDTLGEITKHPTGAQLIGAMMEQAVASRGDVAKSTEGNPAIQKMLNGMTVESLLKQAGDVLSQEQIKDLNHALQQIKKPEHQAGRTDSNFPVTDPKCDGKSNGQ